MNLEQTNKAESFSSNQERAIRALDNYQPGDVIDVPLTIKEAKSKEFLQRIASIDLDFEISIVQGVSGLAQLTAGIIGTDGVAAAGDDVNRYRHERGMFSVHSHITDTPYDLAPSPGDMHVNRKRSFHAVCPALIINKYGFSVVGINPYSNFIDEELAQTSYGDDEQPLNLKNLPASYESFFQRIDHFPVGIDTKLKYAVKLAKEIGLMLAHESWDDVDIVPDYVFDKKAAEKMWLERSKRIISSVEKGQKTLKELRELKFGVVDRIVEEMAEEIRATV